MKIPETRDAAIAALVQGDVERWGEGERSTSQRMHGGRSYGQAINELANRAELAGEPFPELRKAAKAALTSDDWAELYKGG